MAYRVELTARAERDLNRIFGAIGAADTAQALVWFDGLESAVLSLAEYPARNPVIPENGTLRHLLYGSGRSIYRIIFKIDEGRRAVTVLHIRHGARHPLSS